MYTEKEIHIIKHTLLKTFDDGEVEYVLTACQKLGLDLIAKQIYATKRKDKFGNVNIALVTSINGLRTIAESTGEYEGQTQVKYYDENGVGNIVWLEKSKPPWAAEVGIYRKGFRDAVYATALSKSYAQTTQDGKWTKFWATMPEVMIAKVAEAAALRKAFPQKIGQLYIAEEVEKN